MADWTTVAKLDDLGELEAKTVTLEDVDILLVKKNGQVYALHNVCTHMDYSLEEGEIDGETVSCPLHGAKFDIETGAVRAMPAAKGLPTFAVNVDGGDVQLDREELADF